jgi:hypothetical protein
MVSTRKITICKRPIKEEETKDIRFEKDTHLAFTDHISCDGCRYYQDAIEYV